MNNELIHELRRALAGMIDKKCWRSSCIVWGLLQLSFGGVCTRTQKNSRGNLDDYEKGEANVVYCCSWRLEEKGTIIISSHYLFSERENELNVLIDDQVEKIEIYMPCYDVNLFFKSGKILRVFGDDLENSESYLSWYFENYLGECFFLGGAIPIEKVKDKYIKVVYEGIMISCKNNEQAVLIKNESDLDEDFYKDENFVRKHHLESILGARFLGVDVFSEEEEWLFRLENNTSKMHSRNTITRLLVADCAWRLSIDNNFLCSSDSSETVQEEGFKRILNDHITDILNTENENDIKLIFSSGATLRLFNLLKDLPLYFERS